MAADPSAAKERADESMGRYPSAMIAGLPAGGPQDWPTCACGHCASLHETIFDEGDPRGDSERCTVEGCKCKGLHDGR